MTNGMQDYYLTSTQFDSSPYCNSVIDCTDSEGNLSEANVLKLLHDHSASYHEFAEDCGHDYHANTVLSWLGY